MAKKEVQASLYRQLLDILITFQLHQFSSDKKNAKNVLRKVKSIVALRLMKGKQLTLKIFIVYEEVPS